ncbi:hypothetical protein JCM11251_004842 [Rhodosporidiobolus azoricus]
MAPSLSPDDPPLPHTPAAPPPAYNIAIASPLLPAHAPGPLASTSAYAAHQAFQHKHADLNLPSSFFLLRNRAQGKVLDLRGHKTHEGAEFGVHPIKQPQLKGLSLQNGSNNQLFFLDWDGHLNSAAASRAIEVTDDCLTLAFPHPVMAIPSSLSHPLPRFKLDPSTSTLHVLFSSDPLHQGLNAPDDWQEEEWIVEVLPLRKPKRSPGEELLSFGGKEPKQLLSELGTKAGGVLSGLGGFFGGDKSNPTSPNPSRFGFPSPELPLPPPPVPAKSPSGPSSPRPQLPPQSSSSSSDLPALSSPPLTLPSSSQSPLSVPTDEDYASSDSDSSPSGHRPVRVVRLPRNWREKFPSEALRASSSESSGFGVSQWPAGTSAGERQREKELRKWRRRQWEVVPVTVQPVPLEGEERDRAGELFGGEDSDSSDSDEDDDLYATEEEDAAYLSSLRRLSFPATATAAAGAAQGTAHQGAALLSSTFSSAASTAQSTATSAASALSGILSSVTTSLTPRTGRQEEETPSPPLPDLPNPGLRTSSASRVPGDEAGEWGDAAELGREAIEGLGLGGVEMGESETFKSGSVGEKGTPSVDGGEGALTEVGVREEGATGGAERPGEEEGGANASLPAGEARGEREVEGERQAVAAKEDEPKVEEAKDV